MCGIMASATQRLSVAVEYHTRALEVLEWGSRLWKDVAPDDRGCIFERTFIRGVRRLQLTSIHEVSVYISADSSQRLTLLTGYSK